MTAFVYGFVGTQDDSFSISVRNQNGSFSICRDYHVAPPRVSLLVMTIRVLFPLSLVIPAKAGIYFADERFFSQR